MTDFPTLSYTSPNEIPTLSYTLKPFWAEPAPAYRRVPPPPPLPRTNMVCKTVV